MKFEPRLARWSRGLLQEFFQDAEGNGRPVTSILITDDRLKRAAELGEVEYDGDVRAEFLQSFPPRSIMIGWFSGGRDPGTSLVAFLMLCCFAASEAADVDANDYRQRLAELLCWSKPTINCYALPGLWERLRKAVSRDKNFRPLKLPDPDYRTIIGHAIELTFPSRPDSRKLRTLLDHKNPDLDGPDKVIAFLKSYTFYGRFSASFRSAFKAFEAAWRSGKRALADDRFWVGWQLVATLTPQTTREELFVIADDWGGLQLVNVNDQPIDIDAGIRPKTFSRELDNILQNRMPLFLSEEGWGRWRWGGSDRSAKRNARAALICDRAYGSGRLEQFDRRSVGGAPGWSFTEAIAVLLSPDERESKGANLIFDPSIQGVARVDGGLLCRPSFPVRVVADLPLKSVTPADEDFPPAIFSLNSTGAAITLNTPFTGNLFVCVTSAGSEEEVRRTLRLRQSAISPTFNEPPQRLARDVPDWCATTLEDKDARLDFVSSGAETANITTDLMEFFACRAAAIPLGSVLSFLDETLNHDAVTNWDVLEGFYECGALHLLTAVGWSGKSIMARAPSAVFRQTSTGHAIVLEGVVNETLKGRLAGRARDTGLVFEERPGVTKWATSTVIISGEEPSKCHALAGEFGLSVSYCKADLSSFKFSGSPNADGKNHSVRKPIPLPVVLQGADFKLYLCDREKGDAQKVWLVQGQGINDRYWRSRNEALLDLHRLANVPAFRFEDGRLIANPGDCRLPTELARWLRLTSGVSAGPKEVGYVYGVTPEVLEQLKSVLEPFIALNAPPRRTVANTAARSIGKNRVMAVFDGGRLKTIETWRHARHAKGH